MKWKETLSCGHLKWIKEAIDANMGLISKRLCMLACHGLTGDGEEVDVMIVLLISLLAGRGICMGKWGLRTYWYVQISNTGGEGGRRILQ